MGPSEPFGRLLGRVAMIPARVAGALARARRRGWVWRVAVAEDSMRPAIAPGDFLLLDPTLASWPRRGAVVVIREPERGVLALKRVAARPGDRVRIREGYLHLAPDEAWVLGDNTVPSIDSRRYGPLPLGALVGRAWLRYWPASRVGLVGRQAAAGRSVLGRRRGSVLDAVRRRR